MQNKTNQTESSWLSQAGTLGTGVFLIPDVTSTKPRAVRKEYVENITYRDCVQRAALVLAFKWVPTTVASFADIKAIPCNQKDCIDTCVEYGCVCFDGKCE